MRYGVLADVHGNLHALRAVLAELERREVDRYLVAGDLVGYGAQPNECVEVVAGLAAACVAGNHDLMLLGRIGEERCVPLGRRSLAWTRGVLGEDARAFLEALPPRVSVAGGVVMAHGSLDDPQEYTLTPAQARAQIQRLRQIAPVAEVLILGHTHRAWAFSDRSGRHRLTRPVALPAGGVVLNPGAVGQSRDRRIAARCMVLDVDARSATFLELPYDVAGARAALRDVGLPEDSVRLRPPRLARSREALRALLRSYIR